MSKDKSDLVSNLFGAALEIPEHEHISLPGQNHETTDLMRKSIEKVIAAYFSGQDEIISLDEYSQFCRAVRAVMFATEQRIDYESVVETKILSDIGSPEALYSMAMRYFNGALVLEEIHEDAKVSLICEKAWLFFPEDIDLARMLRSRLLNDLLIKDNNPKVLAALAEFGDGYTTRSSAAFRLRQSYPDSYLEFFSEHDCSGVLTQEDYEEYMSSPSADDYDDYEDDE